MKLSAHDISLRIHGHDILRGVLASFVPGHITVLLGPNGAGKTSFLRTLAGLRQPTSGNIHYGTELLMMMSARQRAQQIGLLPQSAEAHWNITARTLVSLGRIPHQKWFSGPSSADIAAIDAAMQATDVMQFADRPVFSLSGGERARVLLARVLAGEPRWLLADEPLAHLDLAHQLDVLDIFRQSAKRGCGVILVLHDLALAAQIADDILILSKGRIAAHGPPATTLTTDIIAQVYDVNVEIAQQSDGSLRIIPLHRAGGTNH